jgi:hypothetical protein
VFKPVPVVRLMLPILAAALVCCGKTAPAPDPLKEQRGAIEKAKAVEGVVEKAAAESRKKIEEAETK